MKKQVKKILVLSFVILVAFSVFAACEDISQNTNNGSCKISFNNLMGAEIPEINQYDSSIGIAPDDMPRPEIAGWNFLGWYTASVGGELIDYIPAGSSSNYTLFAHWEAIPYTITYIDAPSNPNPTTYTAENEIILVNPEWSGLSFSHWQDANGNKVTSIPKGSIGNIELTAYWNSMENLVVPSGDESFIAVYDDKLERYHFIVNLGTINNVVLGELGNARGKLYGQELDWQISETVGFEESIANEIAKTITKSVTNSTEWSKTKEWARGAESSTTSTLTAGLEVDECGVKAKIEASLGISNSVSASWADTTYIGGGSEVGEDESNSTSSTVSYRYDKNTTVSISTKTPSEMPAGTYRYVYAGTVHVFAIVTYDPEEQMYYLDIFSHMDETITEMLLYSPNPDNNVHIGNNDILDYAVDEVSIDKYLNSSYYITYDANGGEGEMPMSVMGVGENCKLYPNAFTKTGYTLLKWELVKDNITISYSDEETVKDIANCGETITLKAIWIPNNYIVKYDANDGEGTMENSSFTYDASSNLSKNNFHKVGYHFIGWNTLPNGKGTSFTNEESILNLTSETDVITLYAQWEANIYTVNYHANGGSGSMSASTHTYDVSQALNNNVFTRQDWVFEGWSTSPYGDVIYNNKASVKNLTNKDGGVVDLYAVWSIVTIRCTGRVNMAHTISQTVGTGRDIAGYSWNAESAWGISNLIKQGFTSFNIVVEYKVKLHGDPTQVGFVIGTDSGKTSNYTEIANAWFLSNISVPSNTILKDKWYDSTKEDTGDKTSTLEYTGKITELSGKYLNLWYEAYTLQFLDTEDYYEAQGFTFTIIFSK